MRSVNEGELHTHTDQYSAVMQCNTFSLQTMSALPHDFGDALIERISKLHVGDHSSLKECPRPEPLGAINDLVRDHEVARLDLFLQAPDGGEGDDGTNAN